VRLLPSFVPVGVRTRGDVVAVHKCRSDVARALYVGILDSEALEPENNYRR
jgi:hypothetical protein